MSPRGLLFVCWLTVHPSAFGQILDESKLSGNIVFLAEALMPEGTTDINVYWLMEEGPNHDLTANKLNVILRALETLAPVSLDSDVFRQFAFILTDSLTYLGDTLETIRRTRTDKRASLLIYFIIPLGDDVLEQIFYVCLSLHITNIYVVMEVWNGLDLITYSPFTQEQCLGYKPKVTCVYREGDFRSPDGGKCIPTPKKLSNFFGCRLSVSVFLGPPHLFLQTGKTGENTLIGLEADILKTMAKTLNFSIVFLWHNISKMAVRFQVSHSEPADISLGRLRTTTIQQRNVTSSFAYCNSKLLLVIHLGRSLFSLERVLIPASPIVWLMIILTLAFFYVVFQIVNHVFPSARNRILGRNNRYPMYWIWVIMLGGPVELRPRGYFLSSILFYWMAMSVIMRCGYQSFVYTSIRMDWKISTPRSFVEALRSGYTFTASLETHRSLMHIRHLPRLIKTYEQSDSEALRRLEQEDGSKTAIIVPHEVFRFHVGTTRHSKLTVAGKPLLEQMISMHFKKQSYLKEPFDLLLGRMQVAGLLHHWLELYLTSSHRRKHGASAPEQIKWMDVRGHFQIYGVMVTVCLFVALLEMLSPRVQILRWFFLRI